MKLLERYLLQVEKYLPRKDREEVSNELKSLILDHLEADERMIDEEEKLKDILTEFGAPISVATRYKSNKPIIYKELEPFMVLIFKVLSIALPSAMIFAKALDVYGSTETVTTSLLFLELLKTVPSILSALVGAFGVVFLIVVGITQSIDKDKIKDDWNPDMLPEIPEDIYKASLVESIFGIAGGIVFLYIFNYQPGLIAIYYDGVREPLLNDNFAKILPLLNLSVALSMFLYLYWGIRQSKDKISYTFDAVLNVFSGIILILLVTSDIFNNEMLEGLNLEILRTLFSIGMWVGAIGSFIGALVMIIKVFIANEKR